MADPSTSDGAGPDNHRNNRRSPRKAGLRRWLLFGLGWVFVLLGVAGLFLPFLQGILFLVIGAVLLATASPRARLLRQRLRRRLQLRWPVPVARYEAWEDRARGWLRRHVWHGRRGRGVRRGRGGGA